MLQVGRALQVFIPAINLRCQSCCYPRGRSYGALRRESDGGRIDGLVKIATICHRAILNTEFSPIARSSFDHFEELEQFP